jgi:hypothetical protein
LLGLIIDGTGEKTNDKAAKVTTVKNLWAPAVNGRIQSPIRYTFVVEERERL